MRRQYVMKIDGQRRITEHAPLRLQLVASCLSILANAAQIEREYQIAFIDGRCHAYQIGTRDGIRRQLLPEQLQQAGADIRDNGITTDERSTSLVLQNLINF